MKMPEEKLRWTQNEKLSHKENKKDSNNKKIAHKYANER